MFFSQLDEQDRGYLHSFLDRVVIKKGEKLFRAGDESKGVFFLESGRLGVQTLTGFENKTQIVALLDPGAPIGEKGFADTTQRKMTIIAIEDCLLLHLSAENFKQIETEQPQLAIALLKKLLRVGALRLQASSDRLAQVL